MAPGIWQILLIVLVILLLFGAGKLPRIMGDLAKGVTAFKKGLKDEDAAAPQVEDKKDKAD
ncbi:MAG: twin-arginine translocase TatA/TatE family subunit [Rhodospirillales bacterium]|nr:twin-arginine translocase TatA/TatE family subunit [Rhodospirillales bacterium]